MNDSGAIHGTESGTTPGMTPERLGNDSSPSRAPADLGIKGSRDQGIREQGAKTFSSTPVRPTGFRTAREETPDPRPDDHPEPIDDTRRIVGYRINRTNSTVHLASLTGPITDILKRKTWATLIRDEGWAFPLSYLAHVEKLLAGADIPIEVFNIEGGPTPGQQARERREERGTSAAVLADIRAARKASQTDQQAIEQARIEAREAFNRALADHPPIEHRDETSTS